MGRPPPPGGTGQVTASHERPFESTTWAWRKVKIGRPPEAMGAAARRATFWLGLHERDARKPTTWVIKLRGGPEGWVEVRARGRVGRFPGYVAIYDVLMAVTSQQGTRPQ
jgi:hypothetical protein